MNKRDIVIGFVVFGVVAGIILWTRKPRVISVESPSSTPASSQEKIEKFFNYTIPEDMEKAELKDLTNFGAGGIVTRKYENNKFELVVLADLEDPSEGFYQGWLAKGKEGEAGFYYVKLGSLRLTKGGYLLEFESPTDYTSYNQVWVTLEKTDDTKPEKRVLEGSF